MIPGFLWKLRNACRRVTAGTAHSRRLLAGLLLLSLPFAGVACRAEVEADAAAFRQVESAGPYTVVLSIAPYPPITMQKVRLRVALEDGEGRPVPGARVRFDLDMPYCTDMPPNKPEAVEEAEGVYTTPAVFTMAGYWEAKVFVEGSQGAETVSFFLKVR